MKCIGEGKGLVYVGSHEPGGRELKEKRGEEGEGEREVREGMRGAGALERETKGLGAMLHGC